MKTVLCLAFAVLTLFKLNGQADYGYYLSSTKELTAAEVVEQIGQQKYLLRLNANSIQTLSSEEKSQLVSIKPRDKIGKSLANVIYGAGNAKLTLMLYFDQGISQEIIETKLSQIPGVKYDQIVGFKNIYRVDIRKNDLEKLSAIPMLLYMEYLPREKVFLRNKMNTMSRLNHVQRGLPEDLLGKGICIGIGDAGKLGSHIDWQNDIYEYSSGEVKGHAGTVLGVVSAWDYLDPIYGRGMAPMADIVMEKEFEILANSPLYYEVLGMTITNNSYGDIVGDCDIAGDYNLISKYADALAINYEEILHVFAAGNDGNLQCGDYPLGYGTVLGAYQSAKNFLSVGMVDKFDLVTPTSSQGPTDDGRIKPEVVALGKEVYSTKTGNIIKKNGGTSFSAPAVAGFSAILTEKYKQLHSGNNPKSALLKALLCNGADDLGNEGPDFQYGFGRVNVKNSLDALVNEQYFEGEMNGMNMQNHSIQVPEDIGEMKIMLYWHDRPASPNANFTLLNDLNLSVEKPDGTIVYPWVLDPNPEAVENEATQGIDHRNNVEQVSVKDAASGMYTLNINASQLADSTLPYFVVYNFQKQDVKLDFPLGGEILLPETVETIHWSSDKNDDMLLSLSFSADNGNTWQLLSDSVANRLQYWKWNVPKISSNECLIKIENKMLGFIGTSAPFSIISRPTNVNISTLCEGYALVTWDSVTIADSFEIHRLNHDGFETFEYTDKSQIILHESVYQGTWFSISTMFEGQNSLRAAAVQLFENTSQQCTWENDLAIVNVLQPQDGRQYTSTALSDNENIEITIKNVGANDVQNAALVFTFLSVNDTFDLPEIASGAQIDFELPNTYNLSATGIYELSFDIILENDDHLANNTLSHSIRHVENEPIVLPYYEGFEQASILATADYFSLEAYEKIDFQSNNGFGRVRTENVHPFAFEGTNALTLDAIEYGAETIVNADFTLNLSTVEPTEELRLNFAFMHHEIEEDNDMAEGVWIRGSDQDSWLKLVDLFDVHAEIGNYQTFRQSFDLTALMNSEDQEPSSSFQIRFSQEGDASADALDREDGYTFDAISVYKVREDISLVEILYPAKTNCALTDKEYIQLKLKNTTQYDLSDIGIYYSINKQTPIEAEFVTTITGDSSVVYTFQTAADFHQYQEYSIDAWIYHHEDDDHRNDSIIGYTIINYPDQPEVPIQDQFEHIQDYIIPTVHLEQQSGTFDVGLMDSIAIDKYGSYAGKSDFPQHASLVNPCFDQSSIIMNDYNAVVLEKIAEFSDTDSHIGSAIETKRYSVIYPNPVEDKLTLLNSVAFDKSNIVIYNSIGQQAIPKMLQTKNNLWLLDVSNLPEGVYFLVQQHEKGNIVTKFLKAKR